MIRLLCFLMALNLHAVVSAQTRAPVRFLVSEAWAMPFGDFTIVEGRRILTGGIMKAWQDELARALGRAPEVVVTSRNRQDNLINEGGVDLRCFTSPEWINAETRSLYEWPTPFLVIEERLVGLRNKPRVVAAGELRGLRIGTVLGYHYPSLEQAFAAQQAKRDDAPNEALALAKLLAGRVDYTVMREIDLRYARKSNGGATHDLVASPYIVNVTPVHCAVVKTGRISLQEFTRVQDQLLKRGRLKAIMAQHLD